MPSTSPLPPTLLPGHDTYAGTGAPINISYGYNNGAAGDENKKLCNDPTLCVQDFVHDGKEFCTHYPSTPCSGVSWPAYKPYACPHPLTSKTGKCDPTGAGTSAYPVA
jgi:hypothetical protein